MEGCLTNFLAFKVNTCLFVCNRGTQFCVTAGSTLIYISAIEGVRPIPYMLYRRGPTPWAKDQTRPPVPTMSSPSHTPI